MAGGSQDGTSSLQRDASLSALRIELERSAHIIFASQESSRRFWLGKGALNIDELTHTYRGRKPCLHGSDAHCHEDVGNPAQDRFCWLKGDVVFETLRQACLEPELRAFVGTEPPRGAMASQTITQIDVTGAPWISPSSIPLNPGLVAIIGARGSGKTALADLIAAGGFAMSQQLNDRSFIRRAAKLVGDAASSLTWGDGTRTETALKHVEIDDALDVLESSRVQYLSQQFVDQLCSAEGVTDTLLGELKE